MVAVNGWNETRQAIWRVIGRSHLLFLGCLLALVTGCAQAPASRTTPSTLAVHGTGARIIHQEWWLLFGLGSFIVLLVTDILGAILIRQFLNPHARAVAPQDERGVRWIWYGGIALPVVILLIVFAFSVRNTRLLAAPPTSEVLTITIVGHRWWWEVQYPDQGFTTANQLYIPVGQAVRVNLTSADVIHSFWVPQLHFKRDLIPGRENVTWLQADEPGVYRGICAEFCGVQHAQMMFMVIALAPERYQAWLKNESQPAHTPTTEPARTGQQLFLDSGCIYCHAIRGMPAAGQVGPDLTHLANRLTLAAGTLENNVGNLGGWILDPQHIKPGSLMPATPLTGPELQAMLAYLSTLQ